MLQKSSHFIFDYNTDPVIILVGTSHVNEEVHQMAKSCYCIKSQLKNMLFQKRINLLSDFVLHSTI